VVGHPASAVGWDLTQNSTKEITMSALTTPVWWMAGRLRNVPAVLSSTGGVLRLVTEDGPVFEVPLAQVGPVRRPWWWFGGGIVLTIGATTYKITFVRPNGAPDVDPSLVDVALSLGAAAVGEVVPMNAVRGLADVRDGRRAANAWKDVLV
jgi:hypothetical protein